LPWPVTATRSLSGQPFGRDADRLTVDLVASSLIAQWLPATTTAVESAASDAV
jgi:hypothetical protein